MVASESGSSSNNGDPISVPAAKEDEVEVLDTGFSPDECKLNAPSKGAKKWFLIDADSKDPLYTSDEWRVANFKVSLISFRMAPFTQRCAHRHRCIDDFAYAAYFFPSLS